MRALVLASVLLVGAPALAGPWVPGRWHFWAQLRESVLIADQRYDAAGGLAPIQGQYQAPDGTTALSRARYRWLLTDLYAELGLASRLSVLLDFYALSAIWQPFDDAPAYSKSAVGVSDLFLGAKLLLFDEEITASILAAVTVPTGALTATLPLGPGDVRGDFVLQVGKIFERPSIFVTADFGARLRGMSYSHELIYAAQVGWTWHAHRRALHALTVSLKLEGRYALGAAVEDGLGVLNPQSGQYTKLGPEVGFSVGRGFTLSAGGHYFVAGRSMPAFGEVALALTYAR